MSEKWCDSSFEDRRWPIIRDDQGGCWERQFPDDTGSSGYGYTGFGWYRQTFQVLSELQQRPFVYLYFGAVDEDAYIYLNGALVYEHSCASTGLDYGSIWTTPFAFDARRHLKYGQMNTIAVRVYNRIGMGGIYKPVYLIGVDRELDVPLMKALIPHLLY